MIAWTSILKKRAFSKTVIRDVVHRRNMMNGYAITIILSALVLCSCAAPTEQKDDTITVAGVNTNGMHIQQVVWLHDTPEMTSQQCPIFAASPVVVLKEQGDVIKIRADKSTVPDEKKWHTAIRKGNIVVGWIKKQELAQVPADVWKKRIGAQQSTGE
jgi:hypothetical protein